MSNKIQEEFIEDIEHIHNGKIEVLGTYVDNKTKVEVRCKICGYIWKSTPANLRRGKNCPKCQKKAAGEKLSMTHEEFVHKLEERHPGAYEVIGTYHRSTEKIRIKCKKCGLERDVFPNNILRNKGLCSCSIGGSKLNTEDFIKELNEKVPGNNIDVIGKFINKHSHIDVQCKVCGYQWSPDASSLLQGHGCPQCFKNAPSKNRKTNEDFITEVKALVGDEYEVLDTYEHAFKKIRFLHKTCGTIFEMTPHGFLGGHRCSVCKGGVAKATEDFEKEFYELVGSEYTLLSEYKNSKTKVKVRHNICGTEYYVTPEHFLAGNRCPNCKKSHGEDFIKKFLTDIGILFEQQYIIEECKNQKPLPFDFAILDNKDKLLGLIEYDGKQHFKPVEFWGGKEYFELCQKRDRIKDSYCATNNIPFLRIPYTYKEEKIQKVIEQFLKDIKAI